MRAATRLPAAFFQRVVEICFGRLQRRRETKDDAAHEGERKREEQHGSVNAELIPTGCKLRRLAGVAGEASKFAPGWNQLGINAPVLFFTLALSLVSGIVFGLAPALQASKTNLNDSLKEGDRKSVV